MTDTLSLHAWLDYFAMRHVNPVQLGLQRMRDAAKRLGVDSFDAVVIIVAGTNGKGSTVAALETIYHQAGFNVASYTSPHLVHFNERIRINQQCISDEMLCELFARLHDDEGSESLTYFEITTLAAFLYFKAHALDVIILEVGMGGRLDATNVIDANLAIITTIDLDHQALLGGTREAIGYEKAGVLRPGMPLIYADKNPPQSVLAYAEDLGVKLTLMGNHYTIATHLNEIVVTLKSTESIAQERSALNPQALAAAVVAVMQLNHTLPVAQTALMQAARRVILPGRLQCVHGAVTRLFDVAHNAQSVNLLSEFIANQAIQGRIYAVFSALKDKDVSALIQPLQSCVTAWFPVQLTGERAASREQLMHHLRDVEGRVLACAEHPMAAYEAAMGQAEPGDWVIVYGSFLIVGAVMASMRLGLEVD